MLNQLFADLDPGEAEAIALACELKPAIVLLDETDGRAEARRLGLPTIGTIGILADARKSGRLQKVKPLLDRLIKDFRFRLSRELYDQLVAGDKADWNPKPSCSSPARRAGICSQRPNFSF